MDRTRLAPDVDAPACARTALEKLRGAIQNDVFERVQLLASEVVANAVKHSGGSEIRMDIWQTGGTVAVVVWDDGPGFTATARAGAITEMDSGFGLPLLDTLATAWGNGRAGEAWVWFEVSPRIVNTASIARAARADELLDIRMAVESLKNHALIALDDSGSITNWGAGPVNLTGFSAEYMLGRHVADLFVPASKSAFRRDRDTAEAQGWCRSGRWVRRSDETLFWAGVELAPIRDRAARQLGLSMLISDLTAHKRELDSREHLIVGLREQAMTDELTGLANRRHWMQVLGRDLARFQRYGTPLAVAMLDLDNFKAYNDAHGHPAGDELLRSVAHEWTGAIRTSDLLARYGGDEFALALPDCPPDLARDVVRRIETATPRAVRASAGLAHAREGDTAETLVERADMALYEAKTPAPRASRPVIPGPEEA